jgi:hypothetical protein
VIASFVLTLRGQKQERELAQHSAERAEEAARLTEGYTTRVVEALETIAASGGVGQLEAKPSRVKWNLRHFSGDKYVLTNEGDATAYGVTLSGHESLVGPMNVEGGPDLRQDEALTFIAARSMATSNTTITVEWSPSPADLATRDRWQYPLPPRPKR